MGGRVVRPIHRDCGVSSSYLDGGAREGPRRLVEVEGGAVARGPVPEDARGVRVLVHLLCVVLFVLGEYDMMCMLFVNLCCVCGRSTTTTTTTTNTTNHLTRSQASKSSPPGALSLCVQTREGTRGGQTIHLPSTQPPTNPSSSSRSSTHSWLRQRATTVARGRSMAPGPCASMKSS